MATVALQKIRSEPASGQQHSFYGKVTGTLYIVDPLGRVVVSTLDSPELIAKGWVDATLDTEASLTTSGVTTVNFGAFPGAPNAQTTIAVTDQIDPSGVPIAWITPVATADHSADEHAADPPMVSAQIVGSTLVINALASGRDWPTPAGTPFGNTANSQAPIGLQQPQPYGAWSVGWAFQN
jgi:hypothetical protein